MPRPIFFRSQVQPFVNLFVERAGSTYLATLLDSHPHIVSLREELAVLRQQGKDGAAQLAWAREFWTPPLLGRAKARGFKSKLVDILDPDGFARLLQEKECRVLCLRRRNTVKGVVSTLNARRLWERAGTWNLLDESKRRDQALQVDFQEFDRLLRQREAWDQELEEYVERLGLPTLMLYYEDLLVDEAAFLNQVFAFLGVRPQPVQGRTLKNTRDNLRDVLANFEELRERYRNTRYAAMFDEVLVG